MRIGPKNFLRNIASFFAVVLIFGLPMRVQAGYWGESITAAIMKQSLEEIAEKIKGVTLGVVKNAAMKTVNEKVLGLVSGSSSGKSLIISDWKDFIYTQSAKSAKEVVLNDILPTMFSGKGSSANYSSLSSTLSKMGLSTSSSSSGSSYSSYLSNIAEQAVKDISSSNTTKYSLDDVCSDPKTAINEKGSFSCLFALSKEGNNAFSVKDIAERTYVEEKTKNEEIAKTQASISGYKPQTNSSGKVVTPSSTISSIISTTQSLPFLSLANSQTLTELTTNLIQTYVNTVITKALSRSGLADTSIGSSFASNLASETTKVTDSLIESGVGTVYTSASNVISSGNVGTVSNEGSSGRVHYDGS